MNDRFTLRAALLSDRGRIRRRNEDAFYFSGYFRPVEAMDERAERVCDLAGERCLFAVCDGMGGQAHGELASAAAVAELRELHAQLPGRDFRTAVQHWVRRTDRIVREASDGGGCTLALLYIEGGAVHLCHAGDSRIYRFHQDRLIRLTRDHSQVELLLSAGLIAPEDVAKHPGRHAITRYLGMPPHVICEGAVGGPIPCLNGDQYLLCSDGVTDMLPDSALETILREEPEPESCAQRIFEAAMEAGGRDNITLTVLRLQGSGEDVLPASDMEEEPTVDLGLPEEAPQTITLHVRQSPGASGARNTDVTMTVPALRDGTLKITAVIGQP